MFDLEAIIMAAGYLGLFGIIFAESGLFIGFFLPGDSLLFTAGFLASQGWFNIWVLVPLLFAAAVIGDNVGYAFGRRVGPRLFKRQDSLLFHHSHLEKAAKFFQAHGGKTIILARFIPVIRTFAPIVAGAGNMDYRLFVVYNLVGGLLWAVGLTLLGYFLGSVIPGVDKYLLPIIAVIIIASILPPAVKFVRDPSVQQAIRAKLSRKQKP
jgi:membrane-associated protein